MRVKLTFLLLLLCFIFIKAYGRRTNIPLYDKKWDAKDGLFRVLKWCEYNGHIMPLYGFVDGNDNVVIPIEYDYAQDMCNGYALIGIRQEASTPLPPYPTIWVDTRYKYSYISRMGKISNYSFEYATSICPVDTSVVFGVKKLQTHFELPSSYYIETRKGKFNLNTGKIDSSESYEETVHARLNTYDNLESDRVLSGDASSMTYEGFTICKDKGLIDEHSQAIITLRKMDARSDSFTFINDNDSARYSLVLYHGYVGIFDKYDKSLRLPCQYDFLSECSKNRFVACMNCKWGVITLNGNVVLPFIYNRIWETEYAGIFKIVKYTGKMKHDFYDGFVPLFNFGCIDSVGRIIVPVKHEGDMGWNQGLRMNKNYIFAKDSLWSVYDHKGNLLFDNEFKEIGNYSGSGWRGIDKQGKSHSFEEQNPNQ